MTQEAAVQEPLVKLGTTFDIAGRKAVVAGFSKDGVLCRVEGEKRMHTIDFKQIEHAVEAMK